MADTKPRIKGQGTAGTPHVSMPRMNMSAPAQVPAAGSVPQMGMPYATKGTSGRTSWPKLAK